MTGREGPGPERPGPDYPPEWDDEPTDLEVLDDLLDGQTLIDPDPRARYVPGIGRVVEPPITGPPSDVTTCVDSDAP